MPLPRTEPSVTETPPSSLIAVDHAPTKSQSPVFYGPIDERSWLQRKRDRLASNAEPESKQKENKEAMKARTKIWTDELGRKWLARGYGPDEDNLHWITEPVYEAAPAWKEVFPFKHICKRKSAAEIGSEEEAEALRVAQRADSPLKTWVKEQKRAWIAKKVAKGKARVTPKWVKRLSQRQDQRRALEQLRKRRVVQTQKWAEDQADRQAKRAVRRQAKKDCAQRQKLMGISDTARSQSPPGSGTGSAGSGTHASMYASTYRSTVNPGWTTGEAITPHATFVGGPLHRALLKVVDSVRGERGLVYYGPVDERGWLQRWSIRRLAAVREKAAYEKTRYKLYLGGQEWTAWTSHDHGWVAVPSIDYPRWKEWIPLMPSMPPIYAVDRFEGSGRGDPASRRVNLLFHTLNKECKKEDKRWKKVRKYRTKADKYEAAARRGRDDDEWTFPDVDLFVEMPSNTAYSVSVSYDPASPPVHLHHARSAA